MKPSRTRSSAEDRGVDRLLAALRRVRAVDADDQDTLARETLTRRLLSIVRAETATDRVTMRRAGSAEEITVGDRDVEAKVRVELAFSLRGAEVVLELQRSAPFDDEDLSIAEAVGGEVVLRLEHARVERDAMRAARQLAMIDTLSRAEGEMRKVAAVADRAAREIRDVLGVVRVSIHLVVEDRLDLIAVRATAGEMETRPPWLRTIPLGSAVIQADVARTKRTREIVVAELDGRARAVLEPGGVRYAVVAPMVVGGSVVGTVSVAYASEAPWDAEQVELVTGFALRLGAELDQLRVLEAERRRARDLELINEIGGLVAKQHQLDAVLRTSVNELARAIAVSNVKLLLVDDARKTLRVAASTEAVADAMRFDIDSRSIAAHTFRAREPIVVGNVAEDARANPTLIEERGTRSILGVPLVANDEPIGVILLLERRHVRQFSKEEVALAMAVANLVSPAIANAKMFDDLRSSYEALARAQADLVTHERLAALGELSAVIAHEVRNPLAVIFNSLGSLGRLDLPNADAKLLLDIVGEEAARLNRIVADLLDFVRPYSSHPRPAQVEVLVHGAVAGAQRALSNPTANVETDIALPSSEVVLDGTMIQQALTNLIVNALQATPAGGRVTVRARSDGGSPRPILRFEVADEGPGVDAQDAARIFQPFFTTKATGTGLGLAVVRRIADALGGTVEVSRGKRRGSVFTLTVPGDPPG